jgi:hypothetical protein
VGGDHEIQQVAQEVAAQAQRQRITLRTIEDSLMAVQSFQASPQYYSFVVAGDERRVGPELHRAGAGGFSAQRQVRQPDHRARFQPAPADFRSRPPPAYLGFEKNLVLRQNPVLMDLDADEQQFPLVLARNVKDFKVECWNTNTLDWADEWDDTNSIPPMVRVTLTLGGNTTDSGSTAPTLAITREIAMPSGTLPIAAQQPRTAGGGARLPIVPPNRNSSIPNTPPLPLVPQ